MTINFQNTGGLKVIELGGGSSPRFRPNCDTRVCFDAAGNPTVDFVADFNAPLPIQSQEWDAVFSHFAMEHIAYPNVPQFLAEVLRILKPGGKAVIVTANTEAQLKWVTDHPEGWDGNDLFESASCKLFGDLRHSQREGEVNTGADVHKAYFSPEILFTLFSRAGFENITIRAYGERGTDVCVEATRPNASEAILDAATGIPASSGGDHLLPVQPLTVLAPTQQTTADRERLFNMAYYDLNSPAYGPLGYWDHPKHEATFQQVMARRPESVLELGCGRGYVLKKIEDVGIRCQGIDISKHCEMTRVASYVLLRDICSSWGCDNNAYDLCLSVDVLDRVPEQDLSQVFAEMARTTRRGLHGISTQPGQDPTRVTIRPIEWWQQNLPPGHQAIPLHDLEGGGLPAAYLRGDGKLKLNVGCYLTMFHRGWTNMDVHDLGNFARQFDFHYHRHDVREGLPFKTGEVDLIYASHFLEHLTYKEGLAFLRECRRVIKPDGAMRLIVPDLELITRAYGNGCCWDTHTQFNADQSSPDLRDFDHVNGGCAESPTAAGKFWSLVFDGHKATYDSETLCGLLEEAGFTAVKSRFRPDTVGHSGLTQIKYETHDFLPCLSLYASAVPRMD